MRRIHEYEILLYETLQAFNYPAMLTLLRDYNFPAFPLADLERLRDNLAALVRGLDSVCERKEQNEGSNHKPETSAVLRLETRDGGRRHGRPLN